MSFDEIMSPLGAERFRREFLGRQPLHLEGDPNKFRDVMSWEILNRLLTMRPSWSAESLRLVLDKERITPQAYTTRQTGRDGLPIAMADPRTVQSYLKRGATLVANSIENLTPELIGVAKALEEALGGRAQANLYLSSKRKQGFKAHFDVHDVFALHVEGEKVWHVFEGVEADPINHPQFATLSDEYMDEHKGRPLMEVRLRPGDLLYLPRGQYHYALAEDGGTVHIAFSVTYPIGVDIISYLHERFVGDPLGRANLPRDPAELHEQLTLIGRRLAEIAAEPALARRIEAMRAAIPHERVTYDLPNLLEAQNIEYRVTAENVRLVERDGRVGLLKHGTKRAVEVPAEVSDVVSWMLERRRFSRAEIASAFDSAPDARIDKVLDDMQKMALVNLVA